MNDTQRTTLVVAVCAVGLIAAFWISNDNAPKKVSSKDTAFSEQENQRRYFDQLIKEHKFAIGMNQWQVERSIGKPAQVNRSVYSSTVSEQWVYGDPLRGATYLYFENGILRSFQDSR